MQVLTQLVARILYAVPFAVFGLFHLMSASHMAGAVPHWVPGGVVWVYITGIAMIAAAVSIISGIKAELACLCLAGLLAVFILTMHFPALANPNMKQMAMMSLLKDTSLMGGALGFAGVFARRRR